VSQAAAERFIRLKAIPAGKCRVLTNGIDTAEFTPDGERRAATRLAMDANSHFVWFTAGRLVQAKDFPNLLEAFRQVRRQFPETELWIAGAPADAKGKRQNEKYGAVWLTAMERGLQDHVRWLGLRRDIPALLDAADAFVMASAWEGMPLAAGEAMAMEKPVVVTDAGGARELVADAGFVVEAKNPAALAEAMIATMQQSRESLAALGRRARRRIQQEFELSAVVDAWEARYRELRSQNSSLSNQRPDVD
jgi:glycosyltransferase involved in cell wall biosynthesis